MSQQLQAVVFWSPEWFRNRNWILPSENRYRRLFRGGCQATGIAQAGEIPVSVFSWLLCMPHRSPRGIKSNHHSNHSQPGQTLAVARSWRTQLCFWSWEANIPCGLITVANKTLQIHTASEKERLIHVCGKVGGVWVDSNLSSRNSLCLNMKARWRDCMLPKLSHDNKQETTNPAA